MRPRSPTLYADVNQTLLDLTAQIQAILGGQFVSLALYGSLALGDFDPDGSDIDFIVVTDGELSDPLVEALQAMHAQFDRCGSPWSGRVEAAYIPLGALNQPAPSAGLYPQVERGTVLGRAPLESGWAFQRHSLRKHGVLVAGRDLRSLIDPVAFAEMQAAALSILQGWLDHNRARIRPGSPGRACAAARRSSS